MRDETNSAGPEPTCCACGGRLQSAFEVEVLGDTKATYHRCTRCESLMVIEPHWLDRSYAITLFPDPDTGALSRILYVNRFIRRMRAMRLLPRRYRSLDYGSKFGMLVALQLDRRATALGYDRYAKPLFAQRECTNIFPDGPFDLITAIEVVEHLTKPVEVLGALRERLAPSGVLLLSTELYEKERWPDPTQWHYLARDQGQHIMLLTSQGLKEAGQAAGLRHLRTVNRGKTPFLHLFVHEKRDVPSLRLRMLALQHSWGEKRERHDIFV